MNDKDNAANLVTSILIASENQRRNQEQIDEATRKAANLEREKEILAEQARAANRKAQLQLDDNLDEVIELNQKYRQLFI
jgi:hypothetical protein